ncbi:hypothetical protein V8E55_003395 [Tylopilus felleus]
MRPASSHTQYALASTDSLIRLWGLLLLCGVHASQAPSLWERSSLALTVLRGFCPNPHSCYVHTYYLLVCTSPAPPYEPPLRPYYTEFISS